MTYPNLFHAYQPLKGSDWLKNIPPEDRQAFSMLGLKEADYGRKGGRALVQKKGKEYFREIGRRRALVTNLRKWITKRIQEEMEKQNEQNNHL